MVCLFALVESLLRHVCSGSDTLRRPIDIVQEFAGQTIG
jgi:hypothetical protein